MKLLGDANWWLPGWLDRPLPTIDTKREADLPESDVAAERIARRDEVETLVS